MENEYADEDNGFGEDLMFQTEVDVQQFKPRSVSQLVPHKNVEDMLNQNYEHRNTLLSQFKNQNDTEFKSLLSKLVKNTEKNVLEMEE